MSFTGPEHLIEMVNQFLGAIVYDVMRWHGSPFLVFCAKRPIMVLTQQLCVLNSGLTTLAMR